MAQVELVCGLRIIVGHEEIGEGGDAEGFIDRETCCDESRDKTRVGGW